MPRLPKVPGPKGHFLVGSYPEMRRDVLGFYTEQVRVYGDLSLHHILHLPVVVVGGPRLIEQVLVAQEAKLEKSFDYAELRRVVGRGLLTSEGDEHKRKRKLIQPSFTHDKIAEYGKVMARRASTRLDGWRDGEVLDLHAEMSAITLEIIAETMLGVDIEGHAQVVAEALDRFMRQFEAMISSSVPTPLWVPTPGNLGAKWALRKMDSVLHRIIDERKQKGAGGDDLLGRLLEARFDDGSALTADELRDELITMVMAGHETTALALTYTLMLLAQHDDVKERLVAELDQVLGGRAPAFADLERLVFTRQVIDESLRLYPPAWGVGRQVKRGETLELDGHRLPAGTQVSVLQWVTHRDPRFWDEPLRFDPDRFAPAHKRGDDEAERPKHAQRPKYAYFPFAGGPRSCVGMHFALMEAVLVLAETMQRFSFVLEEQEAIDLMPAVTLRPRHGLRAQVQRREKTRAARAA